MIVPNFNNVKVVNPDGRLTQEWVFFFSSLIEELQDNFQRFGVVVPRFTQDEIVGMSDAEDGSVVYDTTNNALKVKVSGVFKTVQVV